MSRLELQRLGHERDDVGLRDGLIVPDRKWIVAVRVGSNPLWNEEVSRDLRHGREDTLIGDVACAKLIAHHRGAFCAAVLIARRLPHRRAAGRTEQDEQDEHADCDQPQARRHGATVAR